MWEAVLIVRSTRSPTLLQRFYLLLQFPPTRTYTRVCSYVLTSHTESLNDLTAKLGDYAFPYPGTQTTSNPHLHPPDHGQRSLLWVLGRCSPLPPATTTIAIGRFPGVAWCYILAIWGGGDISELIVREKKIACTMFLMHKLIVPAHFISNAS